MSGWLKRNLTYANVVASAALFLALGGSAYALGRGVIGSREIRDNSVRGIDVRNNSLTARDIDERRLRARPDTYVRKRTASFARGTVQGANRVLCDPGDQALSGVANVAMRGDPGIDALVIEPVRRDGTQIARGPAAGWEARVNYSIAGAMAALPVEVVVTCANAPAR